MGSLLNSITDPTPLQIQNELRLYANEVGGTITIREELGITETVYQIDDTRVRLFERGDDAYLKLTRPSDDDPDFDEVSNFDLDDIEDIEFGVNPQRIHIHCGEGDFYDWGL